MSPTPAHHPARFSRRTGFALAATGAAGGAAALLGAPASAAGPAAASAAGPAPAEATAPAERSGSRPRPGRSALITVSAATVWVEPDLNRPDIDDPSLSTPVDLDAWNASMEDTETRQWLTGKLETQGVLGSRVIVDEIDGKWAKVVVTHQPTPRDPRGYPGWMPAAQLVTDRRFEELSETAPRARVTALRSRLAGTPSGNRPGIEVSFDTILPVLGRTAHAVKVAVPGSRPQFLPASDVVVREPGEQEPTPSVEDVIATGERFLGLRYLWAGVSAWGFDCSGYTFTLFHHHGITLNRDAGDQMHHSGLTPVEREDLRRGDLVFFATEPGGDSIRHVALYLGEDLIMQAPNAERSVEIMSLTEYDPTGEYAGARRVLES